MSSGAAEGRPETPFELWGRLVILALVLSLAAAALFLIASREEGASRSMQELAESVVSGPYRSVGWGAAGALGAVAFAELSLWLFRRRSGPGPRQFGPLHGGEQRLVLREVRERVLAICAEKGAAKAPRLLDELLRGALRVEASDIHLSPAGNGVRVTYRIHGSLHSISELEAEDGQALGIRIKVLAQLETYGRKPQDGRLRHQLGGVQLEARVSALPADTGERIVMRLVRGSRTVPALSELGFPEGVAQKLAELLSKPQGMIFLSGPVGSGKTTTLYSSLQHIVETRGQTTAIVSLEDPIELKLPFATQIQVNPKLHMGFAQALRSVLRQDPNVIMIGEVRDQETAQIATQAGMTGHLILTTIHVDSAPSTFARLTDMGVEPFVAASASIACVSQRLVRTLCSHCRTSAKPDELLLKRLESLGITLGDEDYFEPQGCSYCDGQGFSGRTPIAELLIVTPEIRKLVSDGQPPHAIEASHLKAGGIRLLETGLGLARAGITSLGEVVRVVG
jgi:general secretion pathway protein E